MGKPAAGAPRPVLTVGHSTRTLDSFLALLGRHGVTLLLDVRTVPRSRHNPQFNKDALSDRLREAGIEYRHEPGLGGLRRPRPDSPNGGWRNRFFRGFADHMQTEAFAESLNGVVEAARRHRVALMCAEAVPWRCHRSLIADALTARGIPVGHIVGDDRTREHAMTPFARTDGERVTYPPGEGPARAPGRDAAG